MARPLLIDLYCGAGGASAGYVQAGFRVIGVDIRAQPHYPYEFRRGNALMADLSRAQAIHASPPCQAFSAYNRNPRNNVGAKDFVAVTRELLRATGKPWIIENVPGAPLRHPVTLCGSSFGLDIRRHRLFEANVTLTGLPCQHGWQGRRFANSSNRTNPRRTVEVGAWRTPRWVECNAMQIDWMTIEEIREAIPPAYTKWLGQQLIQYV